MGILPIVTERLILREFEAGDAGAVHTYASDPEVVRYMLWGPNTWQDTTDYLNTVLQQQKEEPIMAYEFAVILKQCNQLIGGCGIFRTPAKSWEGELGYCYHKDFWGRGYASEAAKAIIGFGFETLRLHRIYATCAPDNIGSARVLENSGMKREGHLREHLLQRGKWRDSFLYSILEQEFQTGNGR